MSGLARPSRSRESHKNGRSDSLVDRPDVEIGGRGSGRPPPGIANREAEAVIPVVGRPKQPPPK